MMTTTVIANNDIEPKFTDVMEDDEWKDVVIPVLDNSTVETMEESMWRVTEHVQALLNETDEDDDERPLIAFLCKMEHEFRHMSGSLQGQFPGSALIQWIVANPTLEEETIVRFFRRMLSISFEIKVLMDYCEMMRHLVYEAPSEEIELFLTSFPFNFVTGRLIRFLQAEMKICLTVDNLKTCIELLEPPTTGTTTGATTETTDEIATVPFIRPVFFEAEKSMSVLRSFIQRTVNDLEGRDRMQDYHNASTYRQKMRILCISCLLQWRRTLAVEIPYMQFFEMLERDEDLLGVLGIYHPQAHLLLARRLHLRGAIHIQRRSDDVSDHDGDDHQPTLNLTNAILDLTLVRPSDIAYARKFAVSWDFRRDTVEDDDGNLIEYISRDGDISNGGDDNDDDDGDDDDDDDGDDDMEYLEQVWEDYQYSLWNAEEMMFDTGTVDLAQAKAVMRDWFAQGHCDLTMTPIPRREDAVRIPIMFDPMKIEDADHTSPWSGCFHTVIDAAQSHLLATNFLIFHERHRVEELLVELAENGATVISGASGNSGNEEEEDIDGDDDEYCKIGKHSFSIKVATELLHILSCNKIVE